MSAANFSVSQDAKLEVIQLLLDHMNIKMKPPPPAAPPDESSAKRRQDEFPSPPREYDADQQLGWQAIHHAAKFGLIGQLEELVQHGCDINAKIRGSGNTPLHVAALNDQLEVAKVLLAHGADKSLTNSSHYTAHQVAVIANNMSLAEFIASHGRKPNTNSQADHNQSQIQQRSSASKMIMMTQVQTTSGNNVNSGPHLSVSASAQQLADNFATRSELNNQRQQQQQQQHLNSTTCQSDSNKPIIQKQDSNLTLADRQMKLNPLTLDLANDSASGTLSSAPTTNTSGHSLLSIATPPLVSTFASINHLNNNPSNNLHASNVSPSLSQRSSNTFNTSSSGVCCDGDNSSNNSRNGITIISIGAPATTTATTAKTNNLNQLETNDNSNIQIARSPSLTLGQRQANSFRPHYANHNHNHHHHQQQQQQQHQHQQPPSQIIDGGSLASLAAANSSEAIQGDDQEASETSSSDELQSLMSERRPLFVGAQVRAITCYESGDPSHLQLRRDDLVELLECPRELLQSDGQLPRLANKPLLFGRRQSDGACGLFPSFCVRRARQRKLRASDQWSSSCRMPMSDSNAPGGFSVPGPSELTLRRGGTHLRESQSSGSLAYGNHQHSLLNKPADPTSQVNFVEFDVKLSKVNEGFGFVLRGARIDPSTIKATNSQTGVDRPAKISVDERLMAANKLASLQYFSDIEPNSIAYQMGLKRGDFLVSVNEHDVRLWSHEQVVGMIRKSGDQVRLRVARVSPIIEATRTLTRVKPEPPKRDPTTTLTRNKTARVKSMSVAPQVQQQQQQAPASNLFDADKPLPSTPQNELSSFNSINRSVSSNLAHFSPVSASLASSIQLDSQSIASISTLNSIQAPDSSSSTTTMTTVATKKPHHGPILKPSEQTAPSTCTTQPMSYVQSITETPKPSMSDLQIPPPPPPLPNFSATPTKESLKQQRRTSATSQTTPFNPIQIDKSQLLRRRETLAVVSLNSSHELAPNEPTPICSVAAACAAAANSRRQRQQQKQQEEAEQIQDIGRQASDIQAREVAPIKPVAQVEMPRNEQTEPEKVASDSERVNELPSNPPPPPPPPPKSTEMNGCAQIRRTIEVQHNQQQQRGGQHQQSATLGWRSSAQVIQESKMPNAGTLQHSQTLKISSTRQRMSILDYDSQLFAETSQTRPLEVREQQVSRHQRQQLGDNHRQIHADGHQSQRAPQNCRQVRDESPLEVDRYLSQEQHRLQLLRQQQQQQHLQQQRRLQDQIKLQQQLLHQGPHRCQHGRSHQNHLAHTHQICPQQQQQPSHYAYTSQLAANSHQLEHHSDGVLTRPLGPHHHHAHSSSHQQQIQLASDLRHSQRHHHHNHPHHHQQQLNRTSHNHPHGSAKFIDSFVGSEEQNFRGFYWSAA